jgi:hypothetical protein
MLHGALHAGTSAAVAISIEAVVSHTKSDHSIVHQESLAVPPRMPKSQSQIVMVLYPCKSGRLGLLYT